MPNMPSNGSRGASAGYRGTPQSPAYERRPASKPHVYPAKPQSPTNRNPSRITVERIKPLNTAQARARVAKISNAAGGQVNAKKKQRQQNRAKLKDFLLGFTVGLVIFGIAAAIVCYVLINMFI